MNQPKIEPSARPSGANTRPTEIICDGARLQTTCRTDFRPFPLESTIQGKPGTMVKVIKSGKWGWTDEVLKLLGAGSKKGPKNLVFKLLGAGSKKGPKNLGGYLAKTNLAEFQRHFQIAIEKGLTLEQAKQFAITKTSFGKSKIRLGYKYFKVTILAKKQNVLLKHTKKGVHDGEWATNVPTSVRVEASRTPYAAGTKHGTVMDDKKSRK